MILGLIASMIFFHIPESMYQLHFLRLKLGRKR